MINVTASKVEVLLGIVVNQTIYIKETNMHSFIKITTVTYYIIWFH